MEYPLCPRCGLDMMGSGYSCDCLPDGVDPGRFNPYRIVQPDKPKRKKAKRDADKKAD